MFPRRGLIRGCWSLAEVILTVISVAQLFSQFLRSVLFCALWVRPFVDLLTVETHAGQVFADYDSLRFVSLSAACSLLCGSADSYELGIADRRRWGITNQTIQSASTDPATSPTSHKTAHRCLGITACRGLPWKCGPQLLSSTSDGRLRLLDQPRQSDHTRLLNGSPGKHRKNSRLLERCRYSLVGGRPLSRTYSIKKNFINCCCTSCFVTGRDCYTSARCVYFNITYCVNIYTSSCS